MIQVHHTMAHRLCTVIQDSKKWWTIAVGVSWTVLGQTVAGLQGLLPLEDHIDDWQLAWDGEG